MVTWRRPQRPPWITPEQYTQIPKTLTLREVKLSRTVPGRRTELFILITTLTDAQTYSREDLARLYGFRWQVELDIRQIKQTLHLDHVRCKTPALVRRELWVTRWAYNLIRTMITTAAAVHGKQPRRLSFTRACQSLLSAWMVLASGACRDPAGLYHLLLAHLAAHEVADRPGRIEPRVLKRRRQHYHFMQRPRAQLQAELRRT